MPHLEPDPELEKTLEQLSRAQIQTLREQWRTIFRAEPPKAFGPDLLRRSIAYKIQEDTFGGLDRASARLLRQLMEQYAKNNGRIVLPRRIRPGAMLIRDWQGERHQVTVLDDAFAYKGKPYASLSQIARLITGARWNGPKFFGLRNKE